MFTTYYPNLLDRMLDWSRQMDDAMQRASAGVTDSPVRAQLWLPAVDLYETDTAFVIEADLPGVHQENVDIQFDRGTLTITGTRAATLPVQRENGQLRVFSSERLAGSFSRSIRLPEHVDAEHIEAVFAQGVLTLKVPKAKGALPRKISIKAAESAPALTK
ncbi:MAG TPA: Hsp20/alpha crystallin family protein [Gemmatimonadaceae bacterium]|nr:Hsp20/alpha crystallin family protein [Gemmatimonadaceae bacterium]